MKKNIMLLLTIFAIILIAIGSYYAYKFYNMPIAKEVHCYYYDSDGERHDDYYTINNGKIVGLYTVGKSKKESVDQNKYNNLASKNNDEYKSLLEGYSYEDKHVTEYRYYNYNLMSEEQLEYFRPIIKDNADFKFEKDFFKYKYSTNPDGEVKYHCDWNAF